MNDSIRDFDNLKVAISKIKSMSSDIAVFVVANVKDITQNIKDYDSHSIVTEYFTENELEEIISAFRSNNIYTDISTEEAEFIEKIISGKFKELPHKYKIVYTSAQKGTGPGRKSLIPSFCNMNNIQIIGSNAYVRALCRHKYHSYCILKYHGIQNLKAWQYDYKGKWLQSNKPDLGTKVIVKPIYESASIGIDENSIVIVKEGFENLITKISSQFDQPVIIQEFISGYEVEVPIINDSFNFTSLGAIGISTMNKNLLGDSILTYDIVYNDNYSFYDFREFPLTLVDEIKQCAEYCSRILGIEGLSRIDFRVSKFGKYYITDIASNPHITKHSSFGYAFDHLGFSYNDLPLSMLALASMKYKWF